MNFVTAVVHVVPDPAKAALFLCEVLDFTVKQQTSEFSTVTNGALEIRLRIADRYNVNGQSLTLELQTNDIAQTMQTFLTQQECKLISQEIRVSFDCLETRLQGPHGIILCLTQEFDEDQLDIYPPLPKALEWDEAAELCLRQLLRLVPIGFRSGARKRLTEYAEMLTGEQGSILVDIEIVVRTLAEATPVFQHQALQTALLERGINVFDYFNQVNS